MDLLKEKFSEDSEAEEVDLEYNGLEDISECVPVLEQFEKLRVLSLASNRLTELPQDLGGLATLEVVDLSENQITNASALAVSLLTLPSLSEVRITSLSPEGLAYLKRKLPGVAINPGSAEAAHEDIVEVGTIEDEEDAQDNLDQFSREALEAVAGLYDEIKEFARRECRGKVQSQLDFGEFVNALGRETREEMKTAKTIGQAQVRKVRAHRRLYDACATELEAVTRVFYPELASLWIQLLRSTDKCLDESLSSIEQLHPPQPRDVTPKSEFESIEESKEAGSEVDRLRKEWNEEKTELEAEVESLKEENRKYLDVIIKHSKTSAEAALRSNLTPSPDVRQPSSMSTNSPARSLSINQLKEFIDELYQAKVKFDQRCVDSRLAIETLADFVKTHLTHKFGLKSLRQEWLAGVWQAVDRYSDEDNDVAVFGKILRSECDEEFRFVQMQVKETATQLLRLFLRDKFPLKTASGLESMLKARMEGQLAEEEWMHVVTYMYNETDAMLLVSLIRDLVQQRTISSPQGGKQLRLSREEMIQNRERERLLRSKIAYADLLKILLDFQLKGHEKFLQGFLRRFRAADIDSDGYINEKEFRELAESMEMNLGVEDLERLLQLVDPFDYQKINFSQCVSLFTNVKVTQETVVADEREPGKLVSILQKLAISESDGFNLE